MRLFSQRKRGIRHFFLFSLSQKREAGGGGAQNANCSWPFRVPFFLSRSFKEILKGPERKMGVDGAKSEVTVSKS